MKKLSKRYAESVKLVEKGKQYDIKEALDIIEKMPKAKFDETIELHVKLGVDSTLHIHCSNLDSLTLD